MTTFGLIATAAADRFLSLMFVSPSLGSMTLALLLDRGSEAVEARFPQPAVLREPFVDFAERLRPESVEAPLPIRPHRDEAGSLEDAQMTRDTGLVDPGLYDDVVDL